MLAAAFISWWYGTGWRSLIDTAGRRIARTLATFSVPTLMRTLFSPWKKIVTTPGAGIDAKIRAMGDNFISRLVGFTIRVLVLFVALLALGAAGIVGMLQIVLWPLVPLFIVGALIKGVTG